MLSQTAAIHPCDRVILLGDRARVMLAPDGISLEEHWSISPDGSFV